MLRMWPSKVARFELPEKISEACMVTNGPATFDIDELQLLYNALVIR